MKTTKQLLQNYREATFALADALAKSKKTRKQLLAETNLPPSKLDWLRQLARVQKRYNLLPEVVYEAAISNLPRYWVRTAVNDGLSSIELRKRIRGSVKTKKEKKVEVAQWARNLMLVENELSRSPHINKEAASAMLMKIQSVIDAK